MSNAGPDTPINLTKASVLIVDRSAHSLDLIGQILRGFGVPTISRASTLEEADKFSAPRLPT